MKSRQRGITFFGLIWVGVLVAALGLVVVQVVPTALEYQAVLKAAQRASQDGTTVPQIRAAFERYKAVDYFDAISGQDLMISKVNERIVVEFAYNEEIHLLGPVYLLIKYRGSTQ